MSLRRAQLMLTLIIVLIGGLTAMGAAGNSEQSAEEDSGVLRLHLMWTNDVHGHIAPEPARFMNPAFPPPLGGGASAARYIKQVRADAAVAGEEVLLMDAGDMFQGAPIGSKTLGTAVIEYYNAIGYDLAVPGNHDFDKGRENCERLAGLSNFPWLACNLIEKSTGEVVDWCQPYLMLEFQGVKIGVIGMITPGTVAASFPKNIEGLDFQAMPGKLAEYRDIVKAEGADIVFLAIHEGLPYDAEKGWKTITGADEAETTSEQQGTFGSNYSYGGMNLMELVNEVPGIDIAVGGHTHKGYNHPWIDPMNHTMCFEGYPNGSSIGHAVLLVDRETKTLLGYEGVHDRGTLVNLFEDELWPDAEITELIRPHLEQTEAAMNQPVGSTAIALGRGDAGSNLVGNLVTDAMCEYFDADFSFQNVGGIRADLPAGELTYGDVFAVLPFGNELVIVEMDGRTVRRVIERKLRGTSGGICVSGATVSYDTKRANWDRVVSLTFDGEPWDPDRIYKVAVTSFLMEGQSGLDFLSQIPADKQTPTGISTLEVVERYLSLHSPVHPRVDNRWVEKSGQAQGEYLQTKYLPES
jgi:5'-nucleotidase / UDP-sugar diphosphatase